MDGKIIAALFVLLLLAIAPLALADDTPICSGNPWIDVRCPSLAGGAVGDGTTDDTAALQAAFDAAVVNNWPVQLGTLTYKVTSKLILDYGARLNTGPRLLSTGATIDGRTIAQGPVLEVSCSGGTAASPIGCFYFKQQGILYVLADAGKQTLATLTAAAGAGVTDLSVSSTAGFFAGQVVRIVLADASNFAAEISAVGAGTITLATGLPGNANSGAIVWQPSYPVVIGKPDFSDAQNTIKLDHLNVNNASTDEGAGGCQFNYVLDSDLWAACVSGGGAAGLDFQQTQFSRISGSGTAQGSGGRGMVLERGYNNSNTILGLDLEVSPVCLSITGIHDGMNTFVSPYFACTTAVEATGSTHNLLINPTYAGNVVNRGPQTGSIQVLGTGNRRPWQFPFVSSYSAAGIDDKTCLSSFNATASTLAVTLPAPLSVENGWSMCFATDNDKRITLTPASGHILVGGQALDSFTVGPGNYELVWLQSDGDEYRVLSATRGSLLFNGSVSEGMPGARWLFPVPSGYSATVEDNGVVLSSFNTAAGLTVTLPSTTGLRAGWTIGVTSENGKGLTIDVNGVSGGNILFPRTLAGGQTSISLAGYNYEFLALQYDGSGNFRVVQSTPATAQRIGLVGPGGVRNWLFPAASAVTAVTEDNGNAYSSFNSPAGFFALTLPPTSTITAGWTIALASDNGKSTAVEVDGGAGEHILVPGTLGAQTTLTLSTNTSGYELAWLQFDGTNFRVLSATPLTANALGMSMLIGTAINGTTPCQTGAIQTDGAYLYLCTAPNTWKRAALATF